MGKSITELKLTPYMTAIAERTFCVCKGLTSVVIPEGITEIGGGVFSECSNIETVRFPTTLTAIGSAAFNACTSLYDISTLQYTHVVNAGNDLFMDCKNIEEAILPETLEVLGIVTSINARGTTFRGCTKLKHVVIKSKNLLTIGSGCFGNCDLLKTAGPIGGNYDIEYA